MILRGPVGYKFGRTVFPFTRRHHPGTQVNTSQSRGVGFNRAFDKHTSKCGCPCPCPFFSPTDFVVSGDARHERNFFPLSDSVSAQARPSDRMTVASRVTRTENPPSSKGRHHTGSGFEKSYTFCMFTLFFPRPPPIFKWLPRFDAQSYCQEGGGQLTFHTGGSTPSPPFLLPLIDSMNSLAHSLAF